MRINLRKTVMIHSSTEIPENIIIKKTPVSSLDYSNKLLVEIFTNNVLILISLVLILSIVIFCLFRKYLHLRKKIKKQAKKKRINSLSSFDLELLRPNRTESSKSTYCHPDMNYFHYGYQVENE